MIDKTLHIIITSESGGGRTLLVRKKRFLNLTLFTVLLAVFLCAGTISGLHYRKNNHVLQENVTSLAQDLTTTTTKLNKELDAARAALAQSRRQQQDTVAQYEQQITALKQEKAQLFEGSITRLDERSKIIKTLMDQIGVKIEVEEDPGHSGGLYIDKEPEQLDKLIDTTDRYLELIKTIPLGRPIQTKISSKYGPRIDPLNGHKAFHSGIDFKGRTGDKIKATGDGVVKKSGYNKWLGKHVVLRHRKGYETLYAHMSKRLVKRGEKVTRGQTIGLVGNTGRSTGSHLHYEVHYRNKTVDPLKFMQVSQLLAHQ